MLKIYEYSLNGNSFHITNLKPLKTTLKHRTISNPTSSLLALNSDKDYDIEVYDMAGNKVMALKEIRLICRTYPLLLTLLKLLTK